MGDKTKIVEKAGTAVARLLINKDPWSNSICWRTDCELCKYEDKGTRCNTKSITYQNTCQLCLRRGTNSVYIGESSRTLYKRSQEHFQEARNVKMKDKSHMQIHAAEEHDGEVNFKIKVLKPHRSAMERQIGETVKIKLNLK